MGGGQTRAQKEPGMGRPGGGRIILRWKDQALIYSLWRPLASRCAASLPCSLACMRQSSLPEEHAEVLSAPATRLDAWWDAKFGRRQI
nr:hypothetical protein CFP56_04458 [Quercus suber]